jgi:hypothetical protein
MPEEPSPEHVLVLSTSEVGLLPVIRSVLQGAGIPFVIQGEHAMGQLPTGELAGLFARRGLGARVLVPAEHAEAARELLRPAEGAGAVDEVPELEP